ncbi:hypothetical protein HPB50_020680 [Hyalomma asiaticum]|uniref:Uncharacterized protein n=1 Tax=Hyalomma asiaticum TaxID=266040 RepID=A0ACB7SG25_HYAAI|nr:hypothetical protein HPB50_020680 [Hyalomma asiaticum]
MFSENRRRTWLARVKRANLNGESPSVRVCGAHIVTGKPSALFNETDPDWAPSLLLGYLRLEVCKRCATSTRGKTAPSNTASSGCRATSTGRIDERRRNRCSNITGIAGASVQTDMTENIEALEK